MHTKIKQRNNFCRSVAILAMTEKNQPLNFFRFCLSTCVCLSVRMFVCLSFYFFLPISLFPFSKTLRQRQICLSVCLSVCLSACQSARQSACLSVGFCRSLCSPVQRPWILVRGRFICFSVCLSACRFLPISLFPCSKTLNPGLRQICLFVCLSVCLSACLSVCLFVCLSVSADLSVSLFKDFESRLKAVFFC